MRSEDLRLKVIIDSILESANNALEEYNNTHSDVTAGRLMGYASCLKHIQDEIKEDQLAFFGLDFDIDEK